ncbi:MAG TPA: nucleoside-triphosphatase [Saprospiraceae bacterium]|nr:nucleoside-triphosphatase [Saprospiraceae bacterium]
MILLLTGPVRTGKSTALMQWVESRSDVGGVITPDVNGVRKIYNPNTKIYHPMEWYDPDMSKDLIRVGKFTFLQSAFTMGSEWIRCAEVELEIRIVIIDEIGKLELEGKGFHDAFLEWKSAPQGKIRIAVVRESLIENVIDYFQLNVFQKITTNDLFYVCSE